MKEFDRLYIDGEWVKPAGTETIDVIDASTEEVMGRIPAGAEADVDLAVEAAARAFDAWSQTPNDERGKYIQRIAEGLEARQQELAETIAGEVGMPVSMSGMIQAGLPIANFKAMVEILGDFEWEEQIGNSLVVKEPIGVIGCITPWNYPLHQIASKVAPALAAGNTIVLKPSEVAPLNAFILAEVIDEVGLPAGVFNLVSGEGPVVGEALAGHPKVDMVSFTGSTRAGKRVSEVAAATVKRVSLELGGKSANIILDDADLDTAATSGLFACYLNSGQTCTAHTRMLVPADKHDEMVEKVKAAAEGISLTDAHDPDAPFMAALGPLISAAQRDRVRSYIEKGIEEGATLVVGGPEQPEGFEKGYFVKPTVFANVSNDMTIAQEEIFGPVLSIIPYEDEEDAIRIANDSLYGLSGGVWSADEERARRVARRMRTGSVDVNGGGYNLLAPFGGYKQSGHGKENGPYGFEEFLNVKSMQLNG
ncbi:aldehyde dehydrogenase family protein [cyanobacterium TDX16]|nr:aldehyde dehydrogenase family protein [cyanobacterium TDX16]